ncbi:MAG TPA: hypothetical protein VK308_14085 [Pyrinomonadaceae bacterium]|nr:hypothetical protein [Pyrinomonadaceae bacterium]
MQHRPAAEKEPKTPLYHWQKDIGKDFESIEFYAPAPPQPNFRQIDYAAIEKQTEIYRADLFKREALRIIFGQRIERNLQPLILVLAMIMLGASNLFFSQIPGSIGLLWIVNILFALVVVYRLIAGVEDDAAVKLKQLTQNIPE